MAEPGLFSILSIVIENSPSANSCSIDGCVKRGFTENSGPKFQSPAGHLWSGEAWAAPARARVREGPEVPPLGQESQKPPWALHTVQLEIASGQYVSECCGRVIQTWPADGERNRVPVNTRFAVIARMCHREVVAAGPVHRGRAGERDAGGRSQTEGRDGGALDVHAGRVVDVVQHALGDARQAPGVEGEG